MNTKRRSAPPLPSLPVLSVDELSILRLADYDTPARMRGSYNVKLAGGLIARRLLERDSTASFMIVRCTEEGLRARAPLTAASTKRVVDEVYRLASENDDPEAAASLEYALWRRVLIEQALGFVPATVTRAALLTTTLPFRRGY